MLQFELGIAVFLLSHVVCSIMTFLRSLQVEEMAMTSKPRKVDIIGHPNFFLSKFKSEVQIFLMLVYDLVFKRSKFHYLQLFFFAVVLSCTRR